MKKTRLLNPALSEIIASMGHKDWLVIADAGLPIPMDTTRIDLALTPGVPGFLETVDVILSELQIEGAIIAEETEQFSPDFYEEMIDLLPDIELEKISHEKLKEYSASARAVVRTGEFTSYANIILISGVDFSE